MGIDDMTESELVNTEIMGKLEIGCEPGAEDWAGLPTIEMLEEGIRRCEEFDPSADDYTVLVWNILCDARDVYLKNCREHQALYGYIPQVRPRRVR